MGKFEDAEEWIEAELNETLDEMFDYSAFIHQVTNSAQISKKSYCVRC